MNDALNYDPANQDESLPPSPEELERAKLDDWADNVADFRLAEKYGVGL